MPSLGEVVREKQRELMERLARLPNVEDVYFPADDLEVHTVEKTEIGRAHDTHRGNEHWHVDYVIWLHKYRFTLKAVVVFTDGSWILHTEGPFPPEGQPPLEEQYNTTALHATPHLAPGSEDLLPIPDNYCSVRLGDRVLWAGELSDLRFTASTRGGPTGVQPSDFDGESWAAIEKRARAV